MCWFLHWNGGMKAVEWLPGALLPSQPLAEVVETTPQHRLPSPYTSVAIGLTLSQLLLHGWAVKTCCQFSSSCDRVKPVAVEHQWVSEWNLGVDSTPPACSQHSAIVSPGCGIKILEKSFFLLHSTVPKQGVWLIWSIWYISKYGI